MDCLFTMLFKTKANKRRYNLGYDILAPCPTERLHYSDDNEMII